MEIINKTLDEIMPYERNPRKNDGAVDKVAESIKEFGFKVPIVIDAAGVIVTGHTRYKAAKKLGLQTVPCIMADDLTPYQISAFRLADNKVAEFSEWDFNLLDDEISEIEDLIDLSKFGFEVDVEIDDVDTWNSNLNNPGALQQRYLVPPFSILDTRAGYWRNRKKKWNEYGIDSSEGRSEDLLGETLNGLSSLAIKNTTLTGTSVFDPVLTELMYRWFCPPDGKIYDCFAGGSVRGIVAKVLGYEYTGIDLRKEQVEANEKNAQDLGLDQHWICDDSLNVDNYLADNSVDLLFTCPPYADLEKYSEDPRDISNMSYNDFLSTYRKILTLACKKVKRNRFAVIVVSDIRDENGYYRGFPDSTIEIMRDNGFEFYNDIVLINRLGTAPFRANKYFKNRKVIKVHQRVLVFYNGDLNTIQNDFPEIDLSEVEEM